MARSSFLQASFMSGELSPLIKGRVDLDQYYQGVQQASDVLIVPQGGLKRRCGTEVVAEAVNALTRNTTTPTMANGGTPGNINDGNLATNTTTNVIGTGGTSGQPDFEIARYDLTASPPAILFIDVRKIKTVTASTTVCNLKIQNSSNGTAWTDVCTFEVSNTERTLRRRLTNDGGSGTRYWRLVRSGDSTGDLGSQTINLAEFNVMANGAAGSSNNVKLFGFAAAIDRQYLCVLTQENLAIYIAGASTLHLADVITPFNAASVMAVREVQTENVMLLFHEDYAPQRIINNGQSNYDSFELTDVPFLNVPQYDYNDGNSPVPVADEQTMTLALSATAPASTAWLAGDTFQIDIEGVVSTNITFAGDTTADQQDSTLFNIQKAIQSMPVMGETGVTVTKHPTIALTYKISCDGESAKDFELFAGFPTSGTAAKRITFAKNVNGKPRKEDVWSSVYAPDSPNAGQAPGRGFPKMGAFYVGRLWLGGTKSKGQSIFASKSGSFFDFDIGEGDDDEAIFVTISARTLTEVIDINPDRGLQVFCAGAEFLVDGITPSTVVIKSQTQHGISDLEVRNIDGATLFIDENGKSLRQYVYDYNEDAYTSTDISVLSSHLLVTPVDFDILAGTSSSDANWVFIINSDGTASVLNTLRKQDINGYTKFTAAPNLDETDAALKKSYLQSCTVIDSEMYQVVKRRQTSTGWRFLVEKWNFDRMLDGSYRKTSSLTSITGLDVYTGNKLEVIGEVSTSGVLQGRISLGQKTVAGGTITLTADEVTNLTAVEVGLPFTPTIQPMPINTDIGAGQNQMREKKIVRMNIRVHETVGMYVDGNAIPFREFTEAHLPLLGSPIPPFTGVVEDRNGGNGWGIDVSPVITNPDSQPFHLQSISFEVSSS